MKNNRLYRIILLILFPVLNLLMSPTAQAQQLETDILFYTNKFRAANGLAPLKADAVIAGQAELHSKAMSSGKSAFGHDGFEQRVAEIARQEGAVKAAAENVAYGKLNAEEVVDTWIKSPPHRKNMLGNYKRIGIGVAGTKGSNLYFTQVFIR